ncbi:MAG: MBL fold metallo-hydrolase [Candidatus Hadarchaeum sp.]|uniref:MBL fold metallo-hydrolase n=1 Tax=Candidatus Hadarchaeum sp. TaxID=2883567 RepID=UPI003D10B1E1
MELNPFRGGQIRDPVAIGNGEIRALPLAFESLGVRGMATYVETDDVRMVIDPGSALGPRFHLSPHEREYIALARSRRAIMEAARRADLLTISHYHFDHYVPNFEDWVWIWSSPEIAADLYRGKLILAKDINANINASQRKRGYIFQKLNANIARGIKIADGNSFSYGQTTLKFSRPVAHGSAGTELGYLLMLTVKTSGCTLVHASDVQGPVEETTLQMILAERPDAVIIGGPPIYLAGYKIDETSLRAAKNNMEKLVSKVPLNVIDHHLLRSLDYRDFLDSAFKEAERRKHRLLAASELLGLEPELLEAKRKELHEKEPIAKEWYQRLKTGDLKELMKSE